VTPKAESDGFASLAAIVVAMLIVFVLIVLYLRSNATGGAKGGPAGSAIDAAKAQAQNFEDQQKKRLEQMQDAVR
jgi:cytochrome oxidase Cu insertion factor (SCO1/SenC/PrrC family)